MPYFRFSLSKSFNINNLQKLNLNHNQLKPNLTYFSKNTLLWKLLNKKNCLSNLNFVKYEKRSPITKIGKKILFCLPPNIGLGDAVEYALSIKAILNSDRFIDLGVAFVGRYKEIFEKFFMIKNIYEDIIDENSLEAYDTIFHITLEIKELSNQKYDRKNIEDLITKYFSVKKFRKLKPKNIKNIKKITIFPISQSPLRTMTIDLLNHIIISFYKENEIEIILDNQSEISNYIEKNINLKSAKVVHLNNLNELLSVIKNINFGIFMDSGPLHVAKILNKKGIHITSSVGKEILLKNFNSILSIHNEYKSSFCQSPCGLVNVFYYKKKVGCYDSLGIQKKDILGLKSFKSLQRGELKKNYVNLIFDPVNCLKKIDKQVVINTIKENLIN